MILKKHVLVCAYAVILERLPGSLNCITCRLIGFKVHDQAFLLIVQRNQIIKMDNLD